MPAALMRSLTLSGRKSSVLRASDSVTARSSAAMTTVSSRPAAGWLPPNYDPATPLWKQARPCGFCGKTIIPAISQEARKRFCNQSCSAKWRAGTPEGKANLSRAGKSPHETRGRTPITPAALWRQPRPCEWCGAMITPRTADEGRKRFCNRHCSATWRMHQPEILAKVHSPEVAAKRGAKKRAWFESGSPEAEAAKARFAAIGAATSAVSRHKMAATHRARGIRPPWIGGKGRGLTEPQRLLLAELGGMPWRAEYTVPVTPRRAELPTCLYLDLALPGRSIAIEVDGTSHRSLISKERDARKTAYLESLGWTVLRFWNKDILTWSATGMPADASISMTLRQHSILPSR